MTAGVVFAGLGLARFHTFHNRTFDLAFYTRMAWGWSHFDFWDPFLEASVLGEHLSPVLLPLGLLGWVFGTANVLLVAQSASAVGAAWTLGRVAERNLQGLHIGNVWWLGAAGLLLHPNVVHVLSYEAHPGTLALWPLAWLLDRIDAGDGRGAMWATVCVLACREDLALMCAMAGVVALFVRPSARPIRRRTALLIVLGSVTYLMVFMLYLHPQFAPAMGSFDLHFGRWGDTPGEAVRGFLADPTDLFAHLTSERNLTYLPRVLAPLALLSLLGPRWLLVALPVFAINLVSTFETTPNLDSHYLTPALPALVMAALTGLGRLPARVRSTALRLSGITLLIGLGWAGLSPTADAFWPDARTHASRRLLEAVHDGSIQAPDALVPHLAERERVFRAPPPDRDADQVVLDASHRDRYAHDEDLLRTLEEPLVRAWLARDSYGLVAYEPPWMLFERGADPRAHLEGSERHVRQRRRLTRCLDLVNSSWAEHELRLHLEASRPCPTDLALRFDSGRVDLLFDGLVSPSHLRAGDRVVSRHRFTSDRPTSVRAIRSSGAPPNPTDRALPLR